MHKLSFNNCRLCPFDSVICVVRGQGYDVVRGEFEWNDNSAFRRNYNERRTDHDKAGPRVKTKEPLNNIHRWTVIFGNVGDTKSLDYYGAESLLGHFCKRFKTDATLETSDGHRYVGKVVDGKFEFC